MPDPLASDEHGKFDVEFDLAHLKRRGVSVAQEIADQAAIIADLFGALPVGHPRRLDHSAVVAEIIDHPDKALIENRSEEHTSELQSQAYLVCRLLLEKKNIISYFYFR